MSDRSFAEFKDRIQEITKRAVESRLGSEAYNASAVKGWCEDIIRKVLSELGGEEFQPFKYLANCLVLSKRSNGVHTVTMSLWDPQNDGSMTEQWSNDTMQCIVTVWGLKY